MMLFGGGDKEDLRKEETRWRKNEASGRKGEEGGVGKGNEVGKKRNENVWQRKEGEGYKKLLKAASTACPSRRDGRVREKIHSRKKCGQQQQQEGRKLHGLR